MIENWFNLNKGLCNWLNDEIKNSSNDEPEGPEEDEKPLYIDQNKVK